MQRIVLYVDDLDRCPPEKVVDVLRAVHLLLTLPLFVVVVAVDPRWLRRALEQHHAALFVPGGQDDELQASPTDYLDKIFQIPFTLRPIGDHAGEYIRSLLPETVQPTPPPPAAGTPPAVSPTPEPASAEVTPSEPSVTPTVPRRPDGDPTGLREDSERLTGPSPLRRVDDLRPEGLRLSAAEQQFLPRLGPLLPTPRSAKRLVNLYRMLRIGVEEAELPAFVGDESGGLYQPAVVLLATVIGMPADARDLLAALKEADPAGDIVAFLRHSDVACCDRLADLIETIDKDILVHRELASYQGWGQTVARFSFQTYDLFLSS